MRLTRRGSGSAPAKQLGVQHTEKGGAEEGCTDVDREGQTWWGLLGGSALKPLILTGSVTL